MVLRLNKTTEKIVINIAYLSRGKLYVKFMPMLMTTMAIETNERRLMLYNLAPFRFFLHNIRTLK